MLAVTLGRRLGLEALVDACGAQAGLRSAHGAGFDPGSLVAGAGFVNMRDRLAAVGGELETLSCPGRGTRLILSIPVEAEA